MPGEPLVQIRPELFEDVKSVIIHTGICAELGNRAEGVAPFRIIRAGNRYGGRVADDLRVVKLRASGIGMGPEDLSRRVSEPRPFPSRATPKVARILVKKSRVNRLGHVIANGQIGIRRREVMSIAEFLLAEGWIRICYLSFARERGRPGLWCLLVEGIVGAILNFCLGVIGL